MRRARGRGPSGGRRWSACNGGSRDQQRRHAEHWVAGRSKSAPPMRAALSMARSPILRRGRLTRRRFVAKPATTSGTRSRRSSKTRPASRRSRISSSRCLRCSGRSRRSTDAWQRGLTRLGPPASGAESYESVLDATRAESARIRQWARLLSTATEELLLGEIGRNRLHRTSQPGALIHGLASGCQRRRHACTRAGHVRPTSPSSHPAFSLRVVQAVLERVVRLAWCWR